MRGTEPRPRANRQPAQQCPAAVRRGAALFTAVLAAIDRQQLAEQQSADSAGRRHFRGVAWHLRIQAGADHAEEVYQPAAGHLVETRLPAQFHEGQALPQPAFHPVAAVAQKGEQRWHEPEQVRPVQLKTGLQRWRRLRPGVGVLIFFDEPAMAGQFLFVIAQGPAAVVGGGGAGVAQADAPVVAGRHQYEREQPARQRLGVGTEALVNPAAVLFGQEHASAVRPLLQDVAAPPTVAAHHQRLSGQRRFAAPVLGTEALPFLVVDRHLGLAAAVAATVAVPVLHDRQMADGH